MSALGKGRGIFASRRLLLFPAQHSGLWAEVLFSILCHVKGWNFVAGLIHSRICKGLAFFTPCEVQTWSVCTHMHVQSPSQVLQRPRDRRHLCDHRQSAARTAFCDHNPCSFTLEGWKHSISRTLLINTLLMSSHFWCLGWSLSHIPLTAREWVSSRYCK